LCGSALIGFGLVLLFGAPLASAQERIRITPSVAISQEYDSNVLHYQDGSDSDLVTRVTPKIRVASEGDRGHARLDLGLHRRRYQDVTDLDATDWTAGWDVDQRVTPRVHIFSESRFTLFENQDALTDDGKIIGQGRPDQRYTRLNGGIRYAVTPSTSVSASFGYHERDFSLGDRDPSNSRRDQDTRYQTVSYLHALTARDRVQLQLQRGNSRFEDIGAGSEENTVVATTAQWARAWDSRWSTVFSAGLRSLRIENEVSDDRSLGLVGAAQITRKLRNDGAISLWYRRETRPSSGLGASLDQDVFGAIYRGWITKRLSFRIEAEFDHFRSAGDSLQAVNPQSRLWDLQPDGSFQLIDVTCSPGDTKDGLNCIREVSDEIDSDHLMLAARLDWRFRKHLNAFLSYRFLDQGSSGSRDTGDFDTHRIMAGFRFQRPVKVK
jgi:hypothetical protein